jgi:curved DNA-binding protein CbpA
VSQQTDHYRTLGVSPDADAAQIKRAYHQLAKQYHPDRVPASRRGWARQQMVQINAAYEVLGDPRNRAQYDARSDYTNLDRHSGQAGRSIRQTGRSHEGMRRRHMERWRTMRFASLAVLAVGLLLTGLLARTPSGYVVAAMVNGCALIILILSLVVTSQ